MDPFSLSFRRRETEREYTRWEIERGLRKLDLQLLCSVAVLCVAAGLRFAVLPASWHHVPLMAFGAAHFAGAAIVWRRLGIEELTNRRTAMVIWVRVFGLVLNLLVNMNGHPIRMTSLLTVVRCDGIGGAILLAWGLRLKFQHHFPFQVASTLARMFISTKRQCGKLMETPGAASAWSVANRIDYWAKSVMEARYGGCSIEPFICPCLHAMVWFHVFGAIILQTYMLRKLEWRSRRTFILTLPEQRKSNEGLVDAFEDTLWTKLMVAVLFMVESAVVWDLNYFLVGAIDSWGV